MLRRRTFSIEEKLSVLREVEENGITETCRRHDLSHSVVTRWRKKFESDGVDGLTPGYSKINPQVRKLEDENKPLPDPIMLCLVLTNRMLSVK